LREDIPADFAGGNNCSSTEYGICGSHSLQFLPPGYLLKCNQIGHFRVLLLGIIGSQRHVDITSDGRGHQANCRSTGKLFSATLFGLATSDLVIGTSALCHRTPGNIYCNP
jgi:hypothetical protein